MLQKQSVGCGCCSEAILLQTKNQQVRLQAMSKESTSSSAAVEFTDSLFYVIPYTSTVTPKAILFLL